MALPVAILKTAAGPSFDIYQKRRRNDCGEPDFVEEGKPR
jgi:hypothetical protein